MSDTWGGGLGFGGAGAASAGEGNPMSGGPSVDVSQEPITQPTPVPDTPVAMTPAGAGEPQRGGIFGSGITFGAPNYKTPDPAMSALDQSANLIEQRVKRANEIATNPIVQFFNPEGVQKARDFAPQAAEALQKIRQQQSAIKAGRTQAETLGLAPGEVADEASTADRVEAARSRALKGDLRVFKGLQAVDPKAAEAIQDQVHEVVAGHIGKAQLAFDSLSGMQNQGQYSAKLNQLRQEGTLGDLEALGLKVPPSFEAFNTVKGREGQALREARIGLDTIRTKLEERNTYQPMEKKEAETYSGRMTTIHGDQITNGTWGRNAAAGTRGLIVNGAADPRDLGKKFTFASPEQRKAIAEEVNQAVPKADLEKQRAFDRTYELATKVTTDGIYNDGKGGKVHLKKGDDFPPNAINTNPNVQQGIAEGLASMLRGGTGGANVGLLKIENDKRGFVQSFFDSVASAKAGAINTISGKEVKPYLTGLTQSQIRDVMEVIKGHNDALLEDRVGPIARRAGALGLDTTAFGFGKEESAGVIAKAIEQGRQEQIDRMLPNHQAIGGGDGVFQLGAQRPGVNAAAPPAGTSPPTTQLPGAPPVATPVQQSNPPSGGVPGGGSPPPVTPQPAAPSSGVSSGSGPAGGGAAPVPMTIAGQTINVPPLPPGATPQYLAKMQRIETGNEKNPWTASAGNGPDGKPLSSAGGAFQFINSTWAASKPPGAPDKAKDATAEQQTQALATLTAKNAASLAANRLPVNDTTLYMAHNLGAGGASTLLQANPNADARTVVGEDAARNNPTFFKGRPTVAKVLERYQAEMDKTPDDGPKPKPSAGGATAEAPGLMTRISRMLSSGPGLLSAAGVNPETGLTPEGERNVRDTVVEHAPAIGSTVGAIVGGGAANVPGGMAGGAAGAAAGQSFKDWMQGREQSATRIGKEAALGGVLGVASEARPLLAGAARVLGSGATEGGAAAIEGGDVGDIAEAALIGGGLALGGEALGRFISASGPAAHKLFSKFTPDAQAELSAQAGKLVEARKVLATEQPKLAGEGAGANPKYEAAKKAEDDASQYIKDHGQKPDDMAYAYEQVKGGTSSGEAFTLRKANAEKSEIGEGYSQIRQDMTEKGVGAVKPNLPVPNGPVSTIRTAENPTGKVPEVFRPDAEHAEMLLKAPAPNWGVKWQQMQDAGSELIKKRMAFLANGDKPSADAMNAIFEGVRNQQKAAAEHVFGEKTGKEVISHLENLDKRYAKVMNATTGMNYEKMKAVVQGGNTPARRELEENFREFAKDDPTAIRAFNAMKAGAHGRMGEEAKLMIPIIAGEFAANAGGIPTVGAISAAIGGHRLVTLLKEYMNAKLLGKPVSFKELAAGAIKTYEHGALNAAGSAAQRALVMQ